MVKDGALRVFPDAGNIRGIPFRKVAGCVHPASGLAPEAATLLPDEGLQVSFTCRDCLVRLSKLFLERRPIRPQAHRLITCLPPNFRCSFVDIETPAESTGGGTQTPSRALLLLRLFPSRQCPKIVARTVEPIQGTSMKNGTP